MQSSDITIDREITPPIRKILRVSNAIGWCSLLSALMGGGGLGVGLIVLLVDGMGMESTWDYVFVGMALVYFALAMVIGFYLVYLGFNMMKHLTTYREFKWAVYRVIFLTIFSPAALIPAVLFGYKCVGVWLPEGKKYFEKNE